MGGVNPVEMLDPREAEAAIGCEAIPLGLSRDKKRLTAPASHRYVRPQHLWNQEQ